MMTERRIAGWLAAVAFFGLALWALHESLRDYHYGDIAAAFREPPSARLVLALAIVTCGSPIAIPDRSGWLRMMKFVIAKNAVSFNSHRMMRPYVTEAYLR